MGARGDHGRHDETLCANNQMKEICGSYLTIRANEWDDGGRESTTACATYAIACQVPGYGRAEWLSHLVLPPLPPLTDVPFSKLNVYFDHRTGPAYHTRRGGRGAFGAETLRRPFAVNRGLMSLNLYL
ncbi:hypothetical protein FRC19_007644 [Serendipita sp. 401]|nr:hypothetical protein FRC19_007644 [Serendipita sp. 401]